MNYSIQLEWSKNETITRQISQVSRSNISGSQQWIYRDLIVPLIYHGGETWRGETNRAHSERTTLDDVLIAVIYFAREVTRYQAICILDREHRNGYEKRLGYYIDYEGQRIKEDRNSVEKLVNENNEFSERRKFWRINIWKNF